MRPAIVILGQGSLATARKIAQVYPGALIHGLAGRALYVERTTMANQKIVPLDEVEPMSSPYFSLIIVPGERWQG